MTHKGWFGTVFKTLHFLPNLQKGPISYSITLHYPGKFTKDKHSSLSDISGSNKEKIVL
jgi:hypothetical protein